MNEEKQIQIIELMDDGATLESSPELKALVEASEEATKFYESLLVSESMLQGFFGGDKAKELNAKAEAFIDEQFEKPSNVSSINFKPLIGFAVAASIAVIAFTIANSPSEMIEPVTPVQIAYEEPASIIEEVIEEPEPLYISGEDMANGLWGVSTEMAYEMGKDRWEIMYSVYEANKENFIDNNINQPRMDREYRVDFSLVENLDSKFVMDEVKRHIFCNC
ncbi:hypothetical protein N9M76_00045 [Gammaproteobacteria bacterium]|nr:hypothetical protein [Gammaproteobacteria bacterium]